MSNPLILHKNFEEQSFEFVERKGAGHPDTLADALAEYLSVMYSNYTLKRYGAVLHHNFDKVGLLGGASYVAFGKGYLIKPIRVLINGRVSTGFGEEKIPVRKILTLWIAKFFKNNLPMVDIFNDLELHYNLSNQSSPGKTYEDDSVKSTRRHWFEPRGLDDLQERKNLVSNDTSLGVGYAPITKLEKLVLAIEESLSSTGFKKKYPWIGSDIKILGVRKLNSFAVTMCIPQIANHVKDINAYKRNLKFSRAHINEIAKRCGLSGFELSINTRDNYQSAELYLTAIGSSIESGDEGLVGRGNRITGLISPGRPISMEGACGKNPVYHIGKVYYVAAQQLADSIFAKFKIKNEVYLASQSGRSLIDPWQVVVAVPFGFTREAVLLKFVQKELVLIPRITVKLLNKKMRLY